MSHLVLKISPNMFASFYGSLKILFMYEQDNSSETVGMNDIQSFIINPRTWA